MFTLDRDIGDVYQPCTFIPKCRRLLTLKSHYNKTKISEMDISNIYLKNESVLKCLPKTGLKIGWLEINKGINDEYLWALHGSVVELHVGGADQQELEHQGLSNLVGICEFIMMRLSDYVVSGIHDKLGTPTSAAS